jgi:hypothetical protein
VENRLVYPVLENADALRPVTWFSRLFCHCHDVDLLARPPGAEEHHYAQGAEDGEENSYELVTFRYLPEQYVKRGHSAIPSSVSSCVMMCEPTLVKRFASRL